MLTRITVTETERHSARFPAGRWADVVITTNDGRVLMSGDVHARGGPEAPMTRQDLEAKYMEFAVPGLGPGRAAAIRDAVLSLNDRDSRFSDLSALIYDPPKASS
jgi:2-methylcitrate dehydratase PrpD